jgi:hypothetical protein
VAPWWPISIQSRTQLAHDLALNLRWAPACCTSLLATLLHPLGMDHQRLA